MGFLERLTARSLDQGARPVEPAAPHRFADMDRRLGDFGAPEGFEELVEERSASPFPARRPSPPRPAPNSPENRPLPQAEGPVATPQPRAPDSPDTPSPQLVETLIERPASAPRRAPPLPWANPRKPLQKAAAPPPPPSRPEPATAGFVEQIVERPASPELRPPTPPAPLSRERGAAPAPAERIETVRELRSTETREIRTVVRERTPGERIIERVETAPAPAPRRPALRPPPAAPPRVLPQSAPRGPLADRSAPTAPRRAAPEAPTIRLSIGRIVVSAQNDAPAAAPAQPRERPGAQNAADLAAYLERRSKGGS